MDYFKDAYRHDNHLPNVEWDSFFGMFHNSEPASVSFSDLPGDDRLIVILATLFYPVAHAIFGRGLAATVSSLSNQVFRTYSSHANPGFLFLDANTQMIVGALWPAALFVVGVELVALMLGALYRNLWFND